MNVIKHDHHKHGEEHKSVDQKYRIPHWKRAYHDSRFWTMLFLMLVAMVFYVVTDNFGSLSRSVPGVPVSTTPAK